MDKPSRWRRPLKWLLVTGASVVALALLILMSRDQVREMACRLGSSRACLSQGNTYLKAGARDKADRLYQRAGIIFERDCARGTARSCYGLAWLLETGHGTKQDVARAKELYISACDAGVPDACGSMGSLLERGRGADASGAAALYEKACNAGSAEDCANLANLLHEGTLLPKDLGRAASLFDKACAGGVAVGCLNLATVTFRGEGTAPAQAAALTLYEKACTLGEAAGCSIVQAFARIHPAVAACEAGDAKKCSEVGGAFNLGGTVPSDEAVATTYYAKACELGAAASCTFVGRLLHDRSHAGKKARDYYSRGCELGDAEGCSRLALGPDALPGGEQTLPLLVKACDESDAQACAEMGRRHDTGDGVPHDPVRAVYYRARACEKKPGRWCLDLWDALKGSGNPVDLAKGLRGLEVAAMVGVEAAGGTFLDARAEMESRCARQDQTACRTLALFKDLSASH
jgi:hypothetical protein